MILKDLLNFFEIDADLPDYLLEESFNDVFLKGDFSKSNNSFKIVAKTRKKVTHTMVINPNTDFPVIIMSELPNGLLNGMKFGLTKGDVVFINDF